MVLTFMPQFNPAQLATYIEARGLRDYLNNYFKFALTSQILPGDDDPTNVFVPVVNPNFPWIVPQPLDKNKVGIYLPSWSPGPHADPQPFGPDGKLHLHFRFANGFEGMNVGLVIDKFNRYPHSPVYVLGTLAQEIFSFKPGW
jgi:hypothetical protein